MKKKIAVIEDDKDYLDILTEILESEGYEVHGAVSGFGILKKICDRKPDLILLDLNLPMLSGEAVVDVFQKNDFISGVPVVVLSSRDIEEIKEAATKIGASAWIQKPVSRERLIDVIEKVLSISGR